jgi:zinc-finger-containing domain
VNCQYCQKETQLVNGTVIYSHRPDLAGKKFYICKPCKAYVGCHPNTSTPLGTVANYELRRLRNIAHSTFDPIWRSKSLSRSEAYIWLQGKLGLSAVDCHIAMFNNIQCKAVVDAVASFDVVDMKPFVQPSKKPHRCPECRKSFSTLSPMRQHMRDAHSKTHIEVMT